MTKAEFIQLLADLPDADIVVIRDADTDMSLHVTEIERWILKDGRAVIGIYGSYKNRMREY